MAQGTIVQCIGAVVDVEFPRDQMPKIYDALKMAGSTLTLEVQQQLGDGIVRTIALGSSDGLRRGMTVTNSGDAIQVPVGKATLGRSAPPNRRSTPNWKPSWTGISNRSVRSAMRRLPEFSASTL